MSYPTAQQIASRKRFAPYHQVLAQSFREAHRRYLLNDSRLRRNFALVVQVRLGLAKSFKHARAALQQDLGRDAVPASTVREC
jgi:hypothetical protein